MTIKELTQQRAAATDPAEYDKFTAQIAQAEKLASIERAKQAKDQAAKIAAERGKAEKTYRTDLSEVDKLYDEMGKLDEIIFKSVGDLFNAVHTRFKHWEKIVKLLDGCRVLSETYGLATPQRKPIALFGGSPVREKEGALMRVWLQRYVDRWRLNEYGEVRREDIAVHGLRGGMGLDDVITPERNF
jgi:hypothetical protein